MTSLSRLTYTLCLPAITARPEMAAAEEIELNSRMRYAAFAFSPMTYTWSDPETRVNRYTHLGAVQVKLA